MARIAARRAICGPYALYFLLKLSNEKLDYSTLLRAFAPDVGTTGASLAEMATAAARLGESVVIARCTSAEMIRLKPPFIVFEKPPVGASGHYLVVVHIDGSGVEVVNCLSGTQMVKSYHGIEKWYGGYVLTPCRKSGDFLMSAFCLCGAICLGYLVFNVRKRKARTVLVGMSFLPCFLTCGECLAGLAANYPHISQLPAGSGWRSEDHDAVNALYLLLRFWEYPVSLSDVEKSVAHHAAGRAVSLLDIQKAAMALGATTSVLRCSPAELKKELPAIAALDILGSTRGTLVLVCHLHNAVIVINGKCEFEDIPADKFRRTFSGYCLVCDRRKWGWAPSSFGFVLVLVGPIAGWLIFRGAFRFCRRN